MTVRSLVESVWADTFAAFEGACRKDPLIAEGYAHAAEAANLEDREAHLGFAAERLTQLVPSLPPEVWRSLLRAALTGQEARTTHIPGIEGDLVWAIRDDADGESLRAHIAPGQVWVRADLVRSDDWPIVRAQAMDAVERTLGQVRPRGPRRGSTSSARDALIAEIAPRIDQMSDQEIDALAVGRSLWESRQGDYDVIAKRVRRLRSDAKGRLSNP